MSVPHRFAVTCAEVPYLFGTQYSGGAIDDALAVARGGRDRIGRFGGVMLAGLLLIALLSVVYLVTLVTASVSAARGNRRAAPL